MNHRLVTTLATGAFLLGLALPAAAAGPCMPGPTYDAACDVNQDGVVNIVDIQLIAGHWNQNGVWTGGSGWSLTGNAGTTPGANFVGTTDNQAFQIKVNNSRAVLIQPTASSPNLVAGYNLNAANSGVVGAAVRGGGGQSNANTVADSFGVVSGGGSNRAGNFDADPTSAEHAAVGGGHTNVASAPGAIVSGGSDNNATTSQSVISGGYSNTASGVNSHIGGGYTNAASGLNASVGGGAFQFATGQNARVGGGSQNKASQNDSATMGGIANEATSTAAAVGGGSNNWTLSGSYAAVPGGGVNTASGNYSFAAGNYAKATSNGAFVWADSTGGDFTSTGSNTWRVRSTNGSAFTAGNASYGLYSVNSGAGNGMTSYAQTPNGANWAALFASNSGSSPGLYANTTGTYAGYFDDEISVNGGCTGCTLMYVALNAGNTGLQPGDVVAALGVDDPLPGTTDPVLRIGLADASGATGVVYRAASLSYSQADGAQLASMQVVDGSATPGDFLLVVIQGVTQVRVAEFDTIMPGQRLTVTDNGEARAMHDNEPRGLNTPILGIALDRSDPATGLAPVLLTAIAN